MRLIIAISLLISGKLWAYPQFIGLGYKTCNTCHYNPFGNGPLNDYGRALGASTIAANLSSHSAEKLGEHSGFMRQGKLPGWFRPSLDYRGLYIVRPVGEDNQDADYIHMVLDANVVLKFGSRDQFFGSFTFGRQARAPFVEQDNRQDKTVTREHYLGWKVNQYVGVYGGLMDKVFGIRHPDHIAFSRLQTGITQNAQVYGGLVHGRIASGELGIHYFTGDPDVEQEQQQEGVSVMAEYELWSNSRLGASYLSSTSTVLEKTASALHLRQGIMKGSAILLELGQTSRLDISPGSTSPEDIGRYIFNQNYFQLSNGLYALLTYEYQQSDVDDENNTEDFKMGPGIQYFMQFSPSFPIPTAELRFDLINKRRVADNLVREDSWELLAQVHLWW